MMWAISAKRSDFLDIVASGQPPSGLSPLRWGVNLAPGEMIIAWSASQPRRWELPNLIVLPSQEVRDFLAWSATYLSTIKPLTSFTRVISVNQLGLLLNVPESLSLGRLENGWIGAIIGEALESADGKARAGDLTVRACLSTLAFVMARASALGLLGDPGTEDVGGRWERCRKLLGTPENGGYGDKRAAFEVLSAVDRKSILPSKEGSFDVVTICRALLNDEGVLVREFEALLVRMGIDLPNAREAREDGIQVYEGVVRRLRIDDSLDKSGKAFLVAFALSRVAPGSIEYMDLLLECKRDFPGALIWYGLCAGLASKSEVQSQLESLGRKVAKELVSIERLDGRPRCDVSLDELEILMSGARLAGWRSATPGQLIIELAPLVYVTSRWSASRRSEQADLFEGRSAEASTSDKEVQRLVEELRTLLNQSQSVAERISRKQKSSGELLPERPKTRRVVRRNLK